MTVTRPGPNRRATARRHLVAAGAGALRVGGPASEAGVGGQIPEQGSSADGVVAMAELGGDEVGHPDAAQGIDLRGDRGLVADNGHVGGSSGALLVEHRPVGGELAVDGEHLGGPLPGAVRVAGHAHGEQAHDPRRWTARIGGCGGDRRTMWLSIVAGPVIHNTVPSASRPASRSIRGASAASSTGTS